MIFIYGIVGALALYGLVAIGASFLAWAIGKEPETWD